MLDFFQTIMIITGGVIACLFWLILILAGLIELFDKITGADKKALELEELKRQKEDD
jgi:hypothetical protein